MILKKNIKLLRPTSSEEVIAEVVSETEKSVTLKNPIRIVVLPSRTKPNEPSIGFAPWIEFAEEKEFSIDKSHILVILTPIKDFVTQYTMTFSPIITRKSEIFLPSDMPDTLKQGT
jgi:hypothetical protein